MQLTEVTVDESMEFYRLFQNILYKLMKQAVERRSELDAALEFRASVHVLVT